MEDAAVGEGCGFCVDLERRKEKKNKTGLENMVEIRIV
jgi:hypothetical protein